MLSLHLEAKKHLYCEMNAFFNGCIKFTSLYTWSLNWVIMKLWMSVIIIFFNIITLISLSLMNITEPNWQFVRQHSSWYKSDDVLMEHQANQAKSKVKFKLSELCVRIEAGEVDFVKETHIYSRKSDKWHISSHWKSLKEGQTSFNATVFLYYVIWLWRRSQAGLLEKS